MCQVHIGGGVVQDEGKNEGDEGRFVVKEGHWAIVTRVTADGEGGEGGGGVHKHFHSAAGAQAWGQHECNSLVGTLARGAVIPLSKNRHCGQPVGLRAVFWVAQRHCHTRAKRLPKVVTSDQHHKAARGSGADTRRHLQHHGQEVVIADGAQGAQRHLPCHREGEGDILAYAGGDNDHDAAAGQDGEGGDGENACRGLHTHPLHK